MSAAPPLVKQEEGEIVPKYEHEGNVSDADAHLLLAFHMHENRGRASTPPPSASRLSIQALLNATEDTPVPMSAPPRLSTFGRAASPRPSSSRPQPTPILSQPPKPRSRAKPSQPLVLDEPRDTGRSTKSMSISVEPEPTPKPKPKKPKPPKLGKGRGRVSKGPKKRSGRGWIIESCTTSGAPSDADSEPGDGTKSKPVVIKDIFGSDSDLTELEDEESSEEEEYDPGLAAFPPVPASSDSEYEPADGASGVRIRRRSKVDYGAFQPSARPSVRIAAKAHSDEDEPRTRSKSSASKSPERQDGESKPSRAKSTNSSSKTASGSNTKSTDVSHKSNDTSNKSNKSGDSSNKSGDTSNKSRSVSKSAETSGSRSRSNSGKASSSRRRQLKPPSMSASSVSLGEWQDDPSEVGKPGRKRADSSQKSKADTKSKTDSASQSKESASQKPKPPTRKSLMKARVDSSSLTELTESSPSLGGRNLESPTMAGRNLSSPSMGGDRELGARSDGGVTHVSESVASLQGTDGEGERARRWDRYHRDQTDTESRDEMDMEPVKQRHPPLLVRDYVSQPGRTRRASESERPDKHKHKTFILSGSSPIKPSFESSDDERPSRKRSRSTRSPSNYQFVKVVPMLVSGHPKGCFMLVPPADKRWLTGSVGSSDVGASEPVSSGESKSDVSEEPPAKRPKMSPSKDKGKGRAVDQSVDGSRKSGRARKPSMRLLESREQDEDEEMADETPARKQVERSESVSVTGRARRTSKLTAKALESARQQSEFSEDSGPQIVLVREKSRRASKLTTKALESARQQSELSDGDSEQIILVREKSRRGSRRVERAESSVPGGSKRSHTEGAESSKPVKKPRQDKTGKSLVELSKGDFILRPQEYVCVHYNYDQTIVPRCTACRKKKSGDTCRFRNIRWIKLDPRSLDPVGVKFDSPPEDKFTTVEYHLPGEWNVTPTIQQVERMQVALAQSLYPILRDELAHAQKPNIIRRNVEIEVRATCDVCATSMFSSCHMCTRCGREYCGACFQRVEEMCPVGTLLEYPSAGRKDPQLHKYRACSAGRIFHVPADFYPVTRFTREELDQAVHETEELIQEAHRLASSTQTQITDWVAGVALQRGTSPQSTEPPALSSAGSSHDVSSPRGTPDPQLPSMPIIASPTMSPTHEAGFATDAPAESGKRPASTSQSGRPDPAGVPSHTITSFDKELDEETFKPLWARGEAIVVHDLLDKFKIKWTPQYFKDEYGEQTCQVVNCQDNTVEDTFVSHFFEMFGKADRSPGILKLKDWPAQADFKDDFPTLFEDFMNALPVPNYTRRDGILNLASHFATNAIAPDLGPKMYNAFTSSEGPGGQGSTRLHMDMADAVNIMMYASKDADGSDGVAAWDIFRACDSDKIRAYLRRHFQDRASQFRDPIHSQMFYLDSDHRKKLYEEEQVYSWRIYQKPGDAVFIPAGCAHQVCNLADCIKVAIDFVSLENIHRCERLTTEFRNENDTFTWKEDVLQLRTMMMYAWRSTRQLHLVWDEACEQGGDAEPSEEQSMA